MPTALTTLWSDRKKRALLIQGLVIALLVLFVSLIVSNTAANLEKRGITSGLGFLTQPAGFDIVQTLVPWALLMVRMASPSCHRQSTRP